MAPYQDGWRLTGFFKGIGAVKKEAGGRGTGSKGDECFWGVNLHLIRGTQPFKYGWNLYLEVRFTSRQGRREHSPCPLPLSPLFLLVTLIGSCAFFSGERTLAQITPDATLGAEGSFITPTVNVRGLPAQLIEGGATRGINLFHSFSEFNVPEGQRVYFASPTGIETILSRVTGNHLSNILGTLGVDGGANLFLLNPNGITFGQNARLDIAGSFFASTANSLVFEDGSKFSATNPEAPPLLTIGIIPGVQYGSSQPRGTISNAGNLAVGATRSLTLHGSTVTSTGSLTASGGKVQVLGDRIGLFDQARIDVSAPGGGGTVLIGGDFQGQGNVPNAIQTLIGSHVSINADAIGSGDGGRVIIGSDEATRFYGSISAKGGAHSGNGGFVEVSGKQGLDYNGFADTRAANGATGTLLLDPTNIEVVAFGGETSNLNDVDAFADPDLGTPGDTQINVAAINNAAANVILQATNDITFNANVDIVNPGIGLTAQAGNNIVVNSPIKTQSGAIQLSANDTSSQAASGTGSILINANIESLGGSIALRAGGDISVNGANVSTTSMLGNSGDLSIETGRLIVQDGARLTTGESSGRAGNLSIQATESVDVLNRSRLLARSKETGAGGNIAIATTNLTLQDGFVATNSDRGKAGSVAISSLESITIAGSGFISTGTSSSGTGGNVLIETGTLAISDNGSILTSTYGRGNSGNVTLRAANAVNVTGNGVLSTESLGTGAGGTMEIETGQLLISDGAEVSTVSIAGNAGKLTIRTGELQVRDEAIVSTASEAGNAGDLTIQATEFVNLVDGGSLLAVSTSTGAGGNIAINTRNLTLQNGGQIDTTTIDRGNAGSIAINSLESVTVEGNGSVISASSFGSGTGGNLSINTGTLTIGDGGGVFTSTAGQGDAGNLIVKAANSVNVIDSGLLSTGTLGTGAGGNLSIATRNLNIQNSGRVFSSSLDASMFDFSRLDPTLYPPASIRRIRNSVNTAARGDFTQGNSGNVTVRATDSVTLANSGILSTLAFGKASGGLLSLETGQLTIQDDAEVSSSAFGQGRGGDIQLQANSLSLASSGLLASRSEGSGRAGNMTINLRDELRSSQGDIVATSTQTGGGDITIKARDIRLRDRSLISTSVFDNTGGGGNITINSETFVILDDSDILANAAAGPGGDITINSPVFLAALFSTNQATAVGRNPGDLTQFRGNNRVDISDNFVGVDDSDRITIVGDFAPFRGNDRVDISAASQSGTNGIVRIPNNQDVGRLSELPTNLVDPEGLIDRRCTRAGADRGSSFVVTGRGGLPPSPNETLRGEAVITNWVTLDSEEENTNSAARETNPTSTRPKQLVEAQSWVYGTDGQVILVASAPTVTPHSSWQTAPSCRNLLP
jgi:filamentous hemagglutinin family protein